MIGTHSSVLAGIAECRAAYRFGPDSVAVSWLPFAFAMTLYLKVLGPLFAGGRGCFLTAGDFVADPARWLRLISDYGGTLSGAPNFGYERMLGMLADRALPGLDLSRLHTLINGGERMNPDTMSATQAALAPYGLPVNAATPTYGITEASLTATKPFGSTYRVREFDKSLLEQRIIAAVRDEPARLVSCGVPTGQTVAVVDPDALVPVAEGTVGEIWLSGDSIATGYWHRPDKTAASFVDGATGSDAALAGRRWLRTGDLGFLHEGEIYIAGRHKEVVIVNGRNIHPPDIDAVLIADSSVRAAVAYGYDADSVEQIGVVVEVEAGQDTESVIHRIRRSVGRSFDIQVGKVDVVGIGGIPRTDNGKISRAQCRTRFAVSTRRVR